MKMCPCASNKPFQECCDIFISGAHLPSTPEQLMRSRYTAYVLGNIDYIANTMCGVAANHFNVDSIKIWVEKITWLGLKVLKSNMHQNKGFVEFIASYEKNNKKQKIHEISQFSLIDGKWYYVSGKNPR